MDPVGTQLARTVTAARLMEAVVDLYNFLNGIAE